MRLNLTWGEYEREGWHNVDMRAEWRDINSSIPRLDGRAPESIDEVFVEHFYDHMHRDSVITSLAHHMWMLKPGGSLCVVGTDLYRAIDAATPEPYGTLFHFGVAGQPGEVLPDPHRCNEAAMIRLIGAVFPRPVPVHLSWAEANYPLSARVPWLYALLTHKPT